MFKVASFVQPHHVRLLRMSGWLVLAGLVFWITYQIADWYHDPVVDSASQVQVEGTLESISEVFPKPKSSDLRLEIKLKEYDYPFRPSSLVYPDGFEGRHTIVTKLTPGVAVTVTVDGREEAIPPEKGKHVPLIGLIADGTTWLTPENHARELEWNRVGLYLFWLLIFVFFLCLIKMPYSVLEQLKQSKKGAKIAWWASKRMVLVALIVIYIMAPSTVREVRSIGEKDRIGTIEERDSYHRLPGLVRVFSLTIRDRETGERYTASAHGSGMAQARGQITFRIAGEGEAYLPEIQEATIFIVLFMLLLMVIHLFLGRMFKPSHLACLAEYDLLIEEARLGELEGAKPGGTFPIAKNPDDQLASHSRSGLGRTSTSLTPREELELYRQENPKFPITIKRRFSFHLFYIVVILMFTFLGLGINAYERLPWWGIGLIGLFIVWILYIQLSTPIKFVIEQDRLHLISVLRKETVLVAHLLALQMDEDVVELHLLDREKPLPISNAALDHEKFYSLLEEWHSQFMEEQESRYGNPVFSKKRPPFD